MPRAAEQEETTSAFAGFRWGRFVLWLAVGAVGMISVLLAWRQIEEFLIKDDRFRIPEATQATGRSPHLTFEGVRYASPAKINDVFAEDYGRSLYLAPVQVRRHQLLAIDWVEEATVSKIWPNSLRVVVHERTPVAFIRLQKQHDGVSEYALIDRDGYVLHPHTKSMFTLPVIAGLQEAGPIADRRTRVRRVLAMLDTIGRLSENISEIDATDLNDLVVAEHIDGGVVNLMLGDENYLERLKNFLANYAEIKTKRPETKMLDLRVDGIITAVGGGDRARDGG
ncbi:MAG TPA: cell division protein FtsQ/DivIB [Bryobacteraceae bacterium]|jgi:cell division protein FtsQ|nr:cell division protein FtsQ/DivIB [Bryobacteraceae bacterium]